MKTETKKRILAYVSEKKQVTAKELSVFLGISYQALFKHLSDLTKRNSLVKFGRPPKVVYSLPAEVLTEKQEGVVTGKALNVLEESYLFLSPSGILTYGVLGFSAWCHLKGLPIQKTAEEYSDTLAKYEKFKNGGFIDGYQKIQSTFSKVFLDGIYYLDFYSIERFGKTKLGTLLLYAKYSQDRRLIDNIIKMVEPKLMDFIEKNQIDAVAFIPPTVQRKVQLQKELSQHLNLSLPQIKIDKIFQEVTVPQKTLSKTEDRIINAAQTFYVKDGGAYKNILLIDDAVGSGATLNEVAKKIKEKGMCTGKVIGLALVGSFKGFDVISEV